MNLIISGLLSDKFGRRIVLIFSMIAGGVFPIIRSFSWSYIAFITIEFIDALFVAGTYTAAYVLGKTTICLSVLFI